MNSVFPTIDPVLTGLRIKKLRLERNITIRQIQEYMGFTSEQAIYKWQRGESIPTVDNLYALSKLFGTSMEDILVGNDEMSSRHLSEEVNQQCSMQEANDGIKLSSKGGKSK